MTGGSPEAPPPVLVTPRLRLRPADAGDAPAIFEGYAQDPEVTRYLVWRPHRSIEETHAYLARCAEGWASETEYTWALVPREGGPLLGMIACRPNGHRADLGYVLARAHWGRGYMTEAVRAVVAWALGRPECHRVWAVCDVENGASARVMEKAGLEREGILRRWLIHPNRAAEPRDCLVYARVRGAN